ncbi:cyclase family protein [Pseudonocardia broussonetiae]|uniref:Cyclase family protein n=1 Tax=Pseudonocardia broussonetiae TaxID=2736640 RepID=A0A6M6JU49_9PSEU|nr:cyclase family protein [Pseudonocardia broussonetiae]QJY49969.1 cyclase family protein [Pseudonocardia broussonetiae]
MNAVRTRRTPAFADLPTLPDRDERHAWDVWGRDDELGTVNLIGPEQRLAAARTVRTGEMVQLTLPLDEPDPGLFDERTCYTHVVDDTGAGHDDRLDGFYLQGSSQWDGLRHIRAGRHGYWGGRSEQDLTDTDVLGIDRWAAHGLGGRGVLLDVAGHLAARGTPLRCDLPVEITTTVLDEVARAQGTTFESGDVLVVRTGWTEWYRELPAAERARMRGSIGAGFACPGLESTKDMARHLWDHEFAAVAVDNPGVEVFPIDRAKGFLHRRLIPLQGMPLGELWHLRRLADACAERGGHEFLLVSGVLPLPRGVGSPANAHAVL